MDDNHEGLDQFKTSDQGKEPSKELTSNIQQKNAQSRSCGVRLPVLTCIWAARGSNTTSDTGVFLL